jgi:hypothetical protein
MPITQPRAEAIRVDTRDIFNVTPIIPRVSELKLIKLIFLPRAERAYLSARKNHK